MFSVSGHPSKSIIFDATHGGSTRAAINAGVIMNYMTEFQHNAVDGVIHSAVPEHMRQHMMGFEAPAKNPEPSMLTTKKSPTHASPGHVYFPGSASKYNK